MHVTLNLDHAQRLNLRQLVGNLPASLDNIRQYWALMDMLALSAEEKAAVEYYEQTGPPPDLRRTPGWNPEKSLAPLNIPVTPFELEIIRAAMKTAHYISGPSRAWLESLMDQLSVLEPKKEEAPK